MPVCNMTQGLALHCVSHALMFDATQWYTRIDLDSILAFFCVLSLHPVANISL